MEGQRHKPLVGFCKLKSDFSGPHMFRRKRTPIKKKSKIVKSGKIFYVETNHEMTLFEVANPQLSFFFFYEILNRKSFFCSFF